MTFSTRRLAGAAAIPALAVVLSSIHARPAAAADEEPYFLLRGAGFYGQTLGLGDVEEGQDAWGGEASIGFGRDSFWSGSSGDSRLELEYRYLTGEAEMDIDEVVHDITLNYVEVFGTGRTRPLAGVGLGLSTYTADGNIAGVDFDLSENGPMLQAFGGVNVEIARNVDLEFRLNYAYRMIDGEIFGQDLNFDFDTLTLSAGVTFRL